VLKSRPFGLLFKFNACTLGYDPRRIYEYVHNNIHYQPYFGSAKSSETVLGEGAGNDFDQASLLIALLRASNIPARYGYGIIDLTLPEFTNLMRVDSSSAGISMLVAAGIPYRVVDGGKRIWLKHCYVKAFVPMGCYRGDTREAGDSSWINLAPACKRYSINKGFDILSEMGFNPLGFFEDYIKQGRSTDPMELYRAKISDYLALHKPGEEYQSIKRTGSIVSQEFPILPFVTQAYLYHVDGEFAAIPDSFKQRVKLTVYGENGQVSLTYQSFMNQVSGKRLSLFYCGATGTDSMWIAEYGELFKVPPYLMILKPALSVGGELAATGNAEIRMGERHYVKLEFINELGSVETVYRKVLAGAVYSFGVGTYSIGAA
jgi:hypothetical protein